MTGHVRFKVKILSGARAARQLYTLSLHDALPISVGRSRGCKELRDADRIFRDGDPGLLECLDLRLGDRKSTRLNSSHLGSSYAVFCLKKNKKTDVRAEGKHRSPAHYSSAQPLGRT